MQHKRLLVLMISFNMEKHIVSMLSRVLGAPLNKENTSCDVLLIDDASQDNTYEVAHDYISRQNLPVIVCRNLVHQGWGNNQKMGCCYAVDNKYDLVVLWHGGEPCSSEYVPLLINPILNNTADIVLGSCEIPSRQFARDVLFRKFQNWILKGKFFQFNTGFRAYRVAALKSIPFEKNANDSNFDIDMLIQCIHTRQRMVEVIIPVSDGNEAVHVNSLKYTFQILKAVLLAQFQSLSVFYQARFDYQPDDAVVYADKTGFASSHQWALSHVLGNAHVLDLGAGSSAYVSRHLSERNDSVIAIDKLAPSGDIHPSITLIQADLNDMKFLTYIDTKAISHVLLLDVVEHLDSPETFFQYLRDQLQASLPRILITVPNIAFITMRIGLLFGLFNYGKRGILDLTHKRLFTFHSLQQLMRTHGYQIEKIEAIPAPFSLVFSDGRWSRVLTYLNQVCIRLSKSLFAYQIAIIVRPLPTLNTLVQQARDAEGRGRG